MTLKVLLIFINLFTFKSNAEHLRGVWCEGELFINPVNKNLIYVGMIKNPLMTNTPMKLNDGIYSIYFDLVTSQYPLNFTIKYISKNKIEIKYETFKRTCRRK